MTPREKIILRMAVNYMAANLDDVNDSFADFTAKDPHNEKGNVLVYGKVVKSIGEGEMSRLVEKIK
jgi:hypothetical protein